MSKVPKRRAEDLSKLALGPADKHLLSFVDGWLGEQDLAFITGQSLEAVHADLERLVAAGHIELVEPGQSKPPPSPERAAGPGGDPQPAERTGGQPEGGHGPDENAASGAGDEIQLSAEDRQAIDALHATIERVSDEELLGVGPEATTSEIRKAYNKLARRFHPDRHFRKKLGPYKQKIEEIFVRLTAAHDAMRATRRAQPKTAPPPPQQPRQPDGAAASRGSPPTAPVSSPLGADSGANRGPSQSGPVYEAPRWGTAAAGAIRIDSAGPAGASPGSDPATGPVEGQAPAASGSYAGRGAPAPEATDPARPPPGPGLIPGSGVGSGEPESTTDAAPGARRAAPAPATALGSSAASSHGRVRPGTTLRSRGAVPFVESAARPAPAVNVEAGRAAESSPGAAARPVAGTYASATSPDPRLGMPGRAPAARPASVASPAAPSASPVDQEAARRARAEALARRLGRRAPGGAPVAIRRGVRAPDGSAGAAMAEPPAPRASAEPTAAPDVPVEPYVPVPSAPKSAAEKFRERFGALEARARERRSHAHVAEAISALSRGDYHAAAEAYRLASELAPEDAALARKAAEIGKLAVRRKR